MVIRAKKVNEAFERFSSSGAVHSTQGMVCCPSVRACYAACHVQGPPLGPFSDPGVIRDVTQGGGCDP